jgi:NhaP-type Na+/H+ or K+/H+ antiporter
MLEFLFLFAVAAILGTLLGCFLAWAINWVIENLDPHASN